MANKKQKPFIPRLPLSLVIYCNVQNWVDRDRTYDYGFRVHCVTTSLLPSNLTTSNILKKNRALVNDFFDEGAKKLILA